MKQNKDPFTGKMFRSLWGPAMLSSFGWALSDMADAIVLGQKLGATGLAAISLILPIYRLNSLLAHGLGIGGSVRYSHLCSQGKIKDAADGFNGTFYLSLAFSFFVAFLGTVFMEPLLKLLGTEPSDGALYTATRDYLQILVATAPLFYLSNVFNYYLRNDGSHKRAGIGSVTGNVCDIALNALLVLVLKMGTRGAALATAFGQIIEVCIYLPGFFGNEHNLHFVLPKLRMLRSALRTMAKGLATSVQYLYQTVFILACNNLLIRLGGESTVAVFDVIQNTSYFILYLFESTGRAMQPILSTYFGEHNHQGIKTVTRIGFVCGIAVGSLLIAGIEAFPKGMCLLFGIAGTASETIAFLALRIYGIAALFAGVNILLRYYYQSCENERPAFVIESLRGAVLLMPITYLCCKLGTSYFWLTFLLTEVSTLALFLLLNANGRYRITDISPENIFQKTVPSNSSDVMEASMALTEFCRKWDVGSDRIMLATMTVEELGMAILKHGFQGRAGGCITITAIMNNDNVLELYMRDDATTFNPFDANTKRASLNNDFDVDSLGILVVKERSKEFFYRRYQGFNSLAIKL